MIGFPQIKLETQAGLSALSGATSNGHKRDCANGAVSTPLVIGSNWSNELIKHTLDCLPRC